MKQTIYKLYQSTCNIPTTDSHYSNKKIKEYLLNTCLTAQDNYIDTLRYFRISLNT